MSSIMGKTQGAPMQCNVEDQVGTNLREKSLMPHMKARDALIKDVRFFYQLNLAANAHV